MYAFLQKSVSHCIKTQTLTPVYKNLFGSLGFTVAQNRNTGGTEKVSTEFCSYIRS